MADYWLDTNVLIESKKRYYAFDLAPPFWQFIEQKAAEGVLCASTLVYGELVDESDDDLADWVKDRKDSPLFMEPDQAVQDTFRRIAQYVNVTYAPRIAAPFLAKADGWGIAHAGTYGGTVVTLEKRHPDMNQVKIPNVCERFG